MAVYFVLGSILVVWGLGLAVLGLIRADFPPSGAAGRALVGVTVGIVAATVVALLVTTDKEHPREEAAAKEAENQTVEKGAAASPTPAGATPEQQPSGPSEAGGKAIRVTETEFKIALAGGNELEPGNYTFAVENKGKIEHDLAIEGNGIKETKTPLIGAGQSKNLTVDLKPGKYTFYCSVPGHEESGMKVAVTVGGGGKAAAKGKKPAAERKRAAERKQPAAKTVKATEDEFSIALAGGKTLNAGRYTFAVQNKGKIQHDLAIEGNGIKETKTPLIDGGKSKDLTVDLKPGRYTFYCSVPGHEQAGMKLEVTVK